MSSRLTIWYLHWRNYSVHIWTLLSQKLICNRGETRTTTNKRFPYAGPVWISFTWKRCQVRLQLFSFPFYPMFVFMGRFGAQYTMIFPNRWRFTIMFEHFSQKMTLYYDFFQRLQARRTTVARKRLSPSTFFPLFSVRPTHWFFWYLGGSIPSAWEFYAGSTKVRFHWCASYSYIQ